MTEICDPFAGWHAIGHLWAYCRGMEEACIEVELKGIAVTTALVRVNPSFESEQVVEISEGSFKEYSENGTTWKVYCDGVNMSQMLASIRICYDEAVTVPCSDHETQAACEAAGCYWYGGACHSTADGDAYELPLYGSVTVLGNTFTNTKLRNCTSHNTSGGLGSEDPCGWRGWRHLCSRKPGTSGLHLYDWRHHGRHIYVA